MQMLIEMISTAEEIVVTTTMITVRDELLSFPAQSGIPIVKDLFGTCV